jgi:chromosome segregation ATPase
MTQFVELNDAMGVQKEDVGVIIANVKNTLDKGGKNYKAFFRTIETQCASALAKINSSIKSLQNAVNDATSNVNSWKNNLASATKDRKDAAGNILKGRTQLKGLKTRISKLVMDYKVYATEADKKLNVIKILRDIITDELFNRTPGALVQVSKFQEKLAELKSLLNNNSDSLYSPMISVLLDLATEQNFSDQTVLRKILQNLNNLDKALREFRAKQETTLNSEMKNIKKQIKNVKGRIRAYRRMRQQAVSKAIDANHYISFYNHEITHFNAEKGRMTDELHLFEKLCAFEKKVHITGSKAFKSFRTQVVPYLFSSVQRLKN